MSEKRGRSAQDLFEARARTNGREAALTCEECFAKLDNTSSSSWAAELLTA